MPAPRLRESPLLGHFNPPSTPVATEVLRRIAELYAIEDEVRGAPVEHRRQVRSERSRVIIDDLHQYLPARNRQVSAKAKLGEAIGYALTRWDGRSRFLDDGRVDLDSNIVEPSIRPLALNRKTLCLPAPTKAATTGR